jgi:hypothetical protein
MAYRLAVGGASVPIHEEQSAMARFEAPASGRPQPEDHPDSVLPDDDTVRDEESTPLDHTSNEGVEDGDAASEEPSEADDTRQRGER